MSENNNKVQLLIKKLYGELIDIKNYTATGWYFHHYTIIRPDNMDINVFVSLFEKIRNDFSATRLNTIEKNMYCEITNQDLNAIDKNNLHIIILTNDLYEMDERVRQMMPKKPTKKTQILKN
jgi:hypothetical protein